MKNRIAIAIVATLIAVSAYAADIAGTVTNQDRQRVQARVTLSSVENVGRCINTMTTEDGVFVFRNVRPGTYVVTAINRADGMGRARAVVRRQDVRVPIVLHERRRGE